MGHILVLNSSVQGDGSVSVSSSKRRSIGFNWRALHSFFDSLRSELDRTEST